MPEPAPAPASATPASDVALAARGVRAGYGSHGAREFVLDAVDLDVRPGELVMAIGPNGAGKTTLVRVLAGTLAPAAGRVLLFGRDMRAMERREVARRIAVVHPADRGADAFRVRDVVLMGRAPHQGALLRARAADHERVRAEIDRAEIAHLADRAVGDLSAGERQLVSIARALVQDPDVLLLDEASAHLDVRHAVSLYERVAGEVRSRRLACVAVVHDLNLAAAYAHRVVLLAGGRVAAAGRVEEVMTWKGLRDAFGVDLYVGVNELDGTRYFVPRRG